MTRDEMLTAMIRMYGHENKIVIQFAEMCERLDDNKENQIMLETLVKAHQEYPVKISES